ncbi:MAG: high frequency lysogenization protein HflD [Gammaproteobacteria bacterium]|nr:high frequency lysogenization protein HflD [Gammaproteobacteria bacterium]
MSNKAHTIEERVTALGGLFLATTQVDQIARNGMVDQANFETSIRSLFIDSPEQTIDVYGTPKMIHQGLQSFINHLEGGSKNGDVDLQVIRYSLALLQLERKLNSRGDSLAKIGEGIEQAQRQVEHFSICHSSVIAKLADIYSQVVSPVPPKIIVKGSDGHLQNPENANKIRALLLAGIRAAVLWRQCGGNRWQLLFQRAKHIDCARKIIRSGTVIH